MTKTSDDTLTPTHPGNVISVLIVDDLETDRMRLARQCRKAGLKAEYYEAASLAETQDAMQSMHFDMIFLDYHLDMETGLDVLEIIRADPNHEDTVVLMVTSVGEPEIIVQAMRAGCSDYLVKDEMTVESVRKAITSAFERQLINVAMTNERALRERMVKSINRFTCSTAPDMQRLLYTVLRRLRTLRGLSAEAQEIMHELHLAENSCYQLFEQVDDAKKHFIQAEMLKHPQDQPVTPQFGVRPA
ncbi:response regulator [Tropicibacter oceani]|uniref:Response regulator n=1 Tax=Tropicibacter oceani TaxID=3058420 RepID=A0ABY8QDC5_9RHOB|nr:response regulator [Tropicibacter oceani]WGW02443.1 response regulator [Tropicibacter oceani]